MLSWRMIKTTILEYLNETYIAFEYFAKPTSYELIPKCLEQERQEKQSSYYLQCKCICI